MDKKTLYVFGYGSLMYPSGINGRGMSYIYMWKDLSTVLLSGYKRGMSAYYMYNYYGIMESKKDRINGIIFKIHSDIDFENLMISEKSNKTHGSVYETVDVTNEILPIQHDKRIITLVNIKDKSDYGKVANRYLKHVYNGIQPWGSNFVNTFLKTGGIKPYIEEGQKQWY